MLLGSGAAASWRAAGCFAAAMGAFGGALLAAGDANAQPPAAHTAAQAAAQAAAKRKGAIALHDEAHELYSKGEYRAAIAKLNLALELDPEGKELVYNLALIYEKLGEMDAAEAAYHRYLDMETEPKGRERVEAVLKRLEGAKKELADKKAAAAAAAAPAPAAPQPERAKPAEARSKGTGPWFVVATSVAGGAFAVGSVLALSAALKNPGSDAQTGDGVSITDLQAKASSAHTQAVLADISFLLAAVAGGAAVYLYVEGRAEPKPAAERPAASVAVGVGAGRGVVRVRF